MSDLITIDDSNWQEFVDPVVDGERKMRGLVPRDYRIQPFGSLAYAEPFPIALIPRNEWASRLADRIAAKAQLSNIRERGMNGQMIPSLDQNGYGYCLTPGMLIRMADRSRRPIEEVRVHDQVVSAEGNLCEVRQFHERYYQGEVLRIQTERECQVSCTPNHAILTRRGYVPAGDLTMSDHVLTYTSWFSPDREWDGLRAIVRSRYAGKVYNLGVATDNSYVAGEIGVHNCWAHSTVSCMRLARAAANMPFADLSAYAIACIIKGYRNEGGWGGESMDFAATRGCPTSEFWPQRSVARANDNPATWANAKLHVAQEWMELEPGNVDQFVTCLLLGYPVVSDFNWWSHSVCSMDLVAIDASGSIGSLITSILNSWGDVWSEQGAGRLVGRKALP